MNEHVEKENKFGSPEIERSDADILKGCVKGEATAWNQLVERYQRLIYAIPRRAGLTEEQCADVFQEVFLVLLEKLDKIEKPDRIRAWIVTTAKFKTWGVVRAGLGLSAPASEEDMDTELSMLADPSPLADEVLLELEQQHLIRTALGMLESRCQKIVSMIYLRDDTASYAEVAEAIGVGETSISPMRSRCLKKLEKILRG